MRAVEYVAEVERYTFQLARQASANSTQQSAYDSTTASRPTMDGEGATPLRDLIPIVKSSSKQDSYLPLRSMSRILDELFLKIDRYFLGHSEMTI